MNILTDNGTNFVGFNNLTRELDWEKIIKETNTIRIEWRFNPPSAPWWGGFWERLVGVVKEVLKKVIGKAFLSCDELTTVLCDCEAVVNARPLTYISDDPKELRPLTPALFLQDLPGEDNADLDAIDSKYLHTRLRYVQEVREKLKIRFKYEYLGQLVQFNKRCNSNNPKVGDIVLISSDEKKRILWPLGRILELYVGRDGISRVARIKIQHGELTRPVQRLHLLEIAPETGECLSDKLETCMANDKEDSTDVNVDDGDQAVLTHTSKGRKIRRPKRFNL